MYSHLILATFYFSNITCRTSEAYVIFYEFPWKSKRHNIIFWAGRISARGWGSGLSIVHINGISACRGTNGIFAYNFLMKIIFFSKSRDQVYSSYLNVSGYWWSVVRRSSTLDQRKHFYEESGRVLDYQLDNEVTMASRTDKKSLRSDYKPKFDTASICLTYEEICAGSTIKKQHLVIYSLCILKIIYMILCE